MVVKTVEALTLLKQSSGCRILKVAEAKILSGNGRGLPDLPIRDENMNKSRQNLMFIIQQVYRFSQTRNRNVMKHAGLNLVNAPNLITTRKLSSYVPDIYGLCIFF